MAPAPLDFAQRLCVWPLRAVRAAGRWLPILASAFRVLRATRPETVQTIVGMLLQEMKMYRRQGGSRLDRTRIAMSPSSERFMETTACLPREATGKKWRERSESRPADCVGGDCSEKFAKSFAVVYGMT